jgi:hypothetical protein
MAIAGYAGAGRLPPTRPALATRPSPGLGPRPTPPREGRRLLRHPPRVGERAPQEHLDLRVEAPELVVGPTDQRIVDGRVDPQQDLAALAH